MYVKLYTYTHILPKSITATKQILGAEQLSSWGWREGGELKSVPSGKKGEKKKKEFQEAKCRTE